MIVWLSAAGAMVVAGLAAVRMWSRPRRPRRHDPDWGDWPPDQMAQ